MKKKYPNREETSGNANWLTTFNDLVTLLMVFFVLLFTMSSVDTRKLTDFQQALQSGLGVLEAGEGLSVGLVDPPFPEDEVRDTESADGKSIDELQEEVSKGIEALLQWEAGHESAGQPVKNESETGELSMNATERTVRSIESIAGLDAVRTKEGIRITLENNVIFPLGKAELAPGAFRMLDRIIGVLGPTDALLRIEGHTDNLPIRSRRFPSNWELSTQRAVNVVKYFVEKGGISPRRMSAVGYGASRPVVPNNSSINRVRNRRVEIIMLMEGNV